VVTLRETPLHLGVQRSGVLLRNGEDPTSADTRAIPGKIVSSPGRYGSGLGVHRVITDTACA
jgi:hypothetical protein